VTRKEEVERLFSEAEEAFVRIDVLVNNAGSYPMGALIEMPEEDWDSMIASNLRRPGSGLAFQH